MKVVFASFVFFAFWIGSGAAQASSQASFDPIHVFDRVWEMSRTEIYPESLGSRLTPELRDRLRAEAGRCRSLPELAEVLNPFLDSLGVSHTRFYHSRDPDYHFMRSLFTSRDPDSHLIWHIGVQTRRESRGQRIREVLNGLPADNEGLRRGDLIVGCDGRKIPLFDCFEDGRTKRLSILRNGRIIEFDIVPVFEAPARSFIQAMKKSVRIIHKGERRIGYLRFWIGAFEQNVMEYERLLRDELGQTDALILDLRGGFGGASLERVDHFFADRSTYARMDGIERDGRLTPGVAWNPQTNANPYTRPVAVLINEGVRSGKEMMAFQFKKTGRAVLVGERTAGMFVAGRMWFSDESEDYMLYLAYRGALLDGVKIEGVGVEPDIKVPFGLDRSLSSDPQLEAALNYLGQFDRSVSLRPAPNFVKIRGFVGEGF